MANASTNFSDSGSVANGNFIQIGGTYNVVDFQGALLTVSLSTSAGARKVGQIYLVASSTDTSFNISDASTYPVGPTITAINNLANGANFSLVNNGTTWSIRLTNTTTSVLLYAVAIQLFATP